jgi:radical SAM protein with 4Fe4S-binding SPASM domain
VITPSGELMMCLIIDYPKYKILDIENRSQKTEVRGQRANLKDAWDRLKESVASIKPDKDYKCNRCELEPYCKWCPARGWLYNRNFTSCEPESRTFAENRRERTQQ